MILRWNTEDVNTLSICVCHLFAECRNFTASVFVILWMQSQCASVSRILTFVNVLYLIMNCKFHYMAISLLVRMIVLLSRCWNLWYALSVKIIRKFFRKRCHVFPCSFGIRWGKALLLWNFKFCELSIIYNNGNKLGTFDTPLKKESLDAHLGKNEMVDVSPHVLCLPDKVQIPLKLMIRLILFIPNH